jgi:predicted RNA-binding Zn-ribbon protein involved in translation (DUF1610 family)
MKTNCGSSPESCSTVNFEELSNEKSGLKKIKDADKPCLSSEHNPPSHMVYSPGTYEYTCPSCGKVTIFEVPLIIF